MFTIYRWGRKNTKFGCENMPCRPISSEPLEMLLPAKDKIRSGFYV